jgi:DNA-binding NtrC family response regulator
VAGTILRRAGYQVLEARTPAEAIRYADGDERVDLLLTDVVMPGLTGPELAHRLVEKRPSLRVICMSGYTDGVSDAELGRWPLLRKPVRRDALLAAIRERLDAED